MPVFANKMCTRSIGSIYKMIVSIGSQIAWVLPQLLNIPQTRRGSFFRAAAQTQADNKFS